MKRFFILGCMCLLTVITFAQCEYVDLGLPSGTLWKSQNEEGGFYSYQNAKAKFGDQLPTKEQLEELKSTCKWTWIGKGYKVIGPNEQYIILPAEGFRNCQDFICNVGEYGCYWSSTPYYSGLSWTLYFNSESLYVNAASCDGRSVRLVK